MGNFDQLLNTPGDLMIFIIVVTAILLVALVVMGFMLVRLENRIERIEQEHEIERRMADHLKIPLSGDRFDSVDG